MTTQIKAHLKGKKVSLEGVGFVGSACDVAMKVFEDSLGRVVTRQDKAEIYAQPDPVPEPQAQR